jgi:hypothetical protein
VSSDDLEIPPAPEAPPSAETPEVPESAELIGPPARRWTARRVVLLVTALALLVGLPGGAAAALTLTPRTKPIALPAMPTPSPKPTIPTAVGEMSALRSLVIRDGVAVAVKTLSDALLARDQAAYLKVATTPAAAAMLSRQFRNLAAMRATVYRVNSGAPIKGDRPGQWKIDLSVDVCFVVPACSPIHVVEPSIWQDTAAGPALISLSPSARGRGWFQNPHPWELTDLYVLVGRRALVAAPAALRGRLAATLAAAEKGAAKADLYAAGRKPDLYRVYLAGSAEWKRWFGGGEPKWTVAYSIPTGSLTADVVVNNGRVSASFLPAAMRHELTHVASAYGRYSWSGNWWLIEGYAENAEHGLSWDGSAVTRRYIHGGWNGRLPGARPAANASQSSVTGQYGVGFLAVYRLERRFGRAALIEFFYKVVQGGRSFTDASTIVFHTAWTGVEADLLKFVTRY